MLELRDTAGNFTYTYIQKNSGLKETQASNRMIQRSLRKLGYTYDQCCKKDQLAEDDLKRRLIFA